jgi:formate hydrogenlyase subunit 3/multisubunit Na+/H+ antiporter MnhD subunit
VSAEGPLPGLVLTWQLDGISAFFGLVILSIAAVTTLYAIGHSRHQHRFPGSPVLYLLFILAMLAVVIAGDGFTFLLAW